MARKLADSARLAMGESGERKNGLRFFEKKPRHWKNPAFSAILRLR